VIKNLTPLHHGNYSAAWFAECGERYELAAKIIIELDSSRDKNATWTQIKARLSGMTPEAKKLLTAEITRQQEQK